MSHESQIKAIIEENGFKIINDKTEKLDVEQVSAWYSDKQEEPYYPSLVEYLTRGPIRVLALSRRKAVPKLRDLIGPTNPDMARQSFPKTIRALYGTDIQENAIHASDSRESAEKEIKFFFAEQDPTHTRHL
ncbi:nucleoside diphosphate kinase [Mucor mucedo]|nr:nucleoside diphosphate kinase [Mucor mucedo]KAI7885964.1 nucleoside diphosphate kinase [Mucor mucedo]